MRADLRIALLTFVATTTAAVASAQTNQAPPSRPFEIGASLDGLLAASGEGGGGTGVAAVHVTAPLSGRFAIEGFASIPRHEYESYWGTYGVQIRQRILRASHGPTDVFATYGAMGGFTHSPAHDYSYTSYDGRLHTYHESSRTEVYPPLLALAGIGVEGRVANRLALRFDAQGLVCPIYPGFAGARISAGIAIPLGRVTDLDW